MTKPIARPSQRVTPRQKASSNPIIYQGASLGDLATLFAVNPKDIKAKIAGVAPIGTRNGFDIYQVKEVAPYLVKPPKDIVERILRMHHNDIPKLLSKEFWAGQNNRLTYLERTGDLWDSKAVVELAGDAFKTIRLSLILLTDAVEREVGLDEKQRVIITRLVNATLDNMREKLLDEFENRRHNSSGKSFTPKEDDPAEGL